MDPVLKESILGDLRLSRMALAFGRKDICLLLLEIAIGRIKEAKA